MRYCDDFSCLQNLTSSNERLSVSKVAETRPFAGSGFKERSFNRAVLIQMHAVSISNKLIFICFLNSIRKDG